MTVVMFLIYDHLGQIVVKVWCAWENQQTMVVKTVVLNNGHILLFSASNTNATIIDNIIVWIGFNPDHYA